MYGTNYQQQCTIWYHTIPSFSALCTNGMVCTIQKKTKKEGKIKIINTIEHIIMSTEDRDPTAAEEEEEEEDLEKLQAEIARMEAEAARIAQETEDLDKSSTAGAASSAAAAGKKSDAGTTSKDG